MSDPLEKNLEEGSRKIIPKRIIALTAIGAIPFGIAICFIQVPIGCACGNQSIYTTSLYLRAQQAYHLEEKTFSKSYEALQIGAPPVKTTRYLFSIEVNSDRAYIYATPREVSTDLFRLGLTKAEIYGLVGAVAYVKKQETTVSILCIAQTSTLDKPPAPTFNGEKFTCPSGFVGR